LSLSENEIVPNCAEGLAKLGSVPVIGWHRQEKLGDMADIIAKALMQNRIAVVHSHGSFAIGQLLEEAHNYTTTLEESCQVICLTKSLGVNPLRD
jgi:L-fuculose-phosphate aldolase